MKYPTVGRYPNRVLEDEQFIDHSTPHLPCVHCGEDDCPGYGVEDAYPPCVSPVCLHCGREDCEGHTGEPEEGWDRR